MQHGGDLTEARRLYGVDDPPWLDLSTGINPWPWPVPERLRAGDWTRLPGQAEMAGLIEAARLAYGVDPTAGIVAAPGTQALIQWLPQLAGAGPVAILGPTYGEHALSWRRAGFDVDEVRRPDAIGGARQVVVVNPNNPDGRVLAPAELFELAEGCRARGGWLVVDQSFGDVAPEMSVAGAVGDLPIIVLRSFGKFFGLAGLRLGFAIARPDIADQIEAALGPWAVSAPAIAVGAAALRDRAWAEATRPTLAEAAAALDRVLDDAGLALVGGTSLYRLVHHPRAGAIHQALAAAHIWARRFAWQDDLLRFGLPGSRAELDRLAEALRRTV